MIPQELKDLRQWAVSTGSGGTGKVPINPFTKQFVKTNDPATWVSYNEAANSAYPLVGFVLTENDPYTIIDLDSPNTEEQRERHSKIVAMFNTYTEISMSGKGVHIICRGKINKSFKRDCVEVYDSLRYMITTGNAIKNVPIADCQELLDILCNEMDPHKDSVGEGTESWMSDRTLVEMATYAINGDKFVDLCHGVMDGYPSQSEADMGLLSMLCFYTTDNEQVKRIFRMTALGQREKAMKNDVYLNYGIKRIRNNEIPQVDIANTPPLPQAIAPTIAEPQTTQQSVATTPKNAMLLTYPPGVLGEVAQYITQSNIRPVPEIGIAAAISFMAGLVGRHFNISGTGLNQYVILMAPTGTGKEGAASGIDRLFSYIRESVPAIDDFQGPGAFASGQALAKRMSEQNCYVSVLGEFGLLLKRLASKYASPADVTLKQALLDLYQKSGWESTLKSSVYSDKEKNTTIVQAPALTLLGESTQESLLEELNTQMISDGLLPRFLIVEYNGGRPSRNKHAFQRPTPSLMDKLNNVALTVLAMQANLSCLQVALSGEALSLLDAFDVECDAKISAVNEVYKHLWNRAHLKALKLAGLLAVSDNVQNPHVSKEHAIWAIEFVKRDVSILSTRFEENSVGEGEIQFESLLRKAVEQYSSMDAVKRMNSYNVPTKVAQSDKVIPYPYLRKRFRTLNAFVNHKLGTKRAIEICIEDCLQAGILQEIPPQSVREQFGVQVRLFTIGSSW